MTLVTDILADPLAFPIVVTLAIGLVAYVLSRVLPMASKALALAAGVIVLVRGVQIWQGFLGTTSTRTWVRLTGDIAFSVDLMAGGLGVVVMIGAGAFTLLVTLYSLRSMAGEYWEGRFYAYMIWTLAGACIVALAGNLLVLLIGWEIATLMLFLMINQGRNAQAGAAKTYGVVGFGDACLLLGLALLAAAKGGTENWSLMRGPISVGSLGASGYAAYVLILLAALAKAGAIPVHSWIPAVAKTAPTSVMAFLPAALDKLLGIYLLATLSLQMLRPNWTLQVVMMVIGAVTILAAVLMAMVQHNLKRLLAFHAVSQVGYMVLGIGTGTTIGVIGGLFHMINNALYKSNLFLMSGVIGRASGTDEIEDMGGLAKVLPVTFACGLVSALAISGVPPFNGFVSKWLVYQGSLQLGGMGHGGLAIGLVVVAVFGSALTLASFVKVMYAAFLSPAPKPRTGPKPRESFFLAAPMVVLALGCVLLGLFPNTIINDVLLPSIGPAAATTGEAILADTGHVHTGSVGLWSPGQATGLILVGILLGLLYLWVATRGRSIRVVRPFLAGEVPGPSDDRFRIPGTQFYETVSKLPIIGPLLFHAEGGAMDAYHWAGKHGNTFVQMLRRWHTGLISLYVAWCLLGLTIMLVYLLLTGTS